MKHDTDTHEVAARALLADQVAPSADLVRLEAEASSGCSICARALVNAREAAVDLALTLPPAVPGATLRDRVLAAGRAQRPSPGVGSGSPGGAANRSAGGECDETAKADSSTTVARMHVSGADEPERRREVERLAASFSELSAAERILTQAQALSGFQVLFVGIITGDAVENRVRIGVPPGMEEMLRIVPRDTTFCTHCVNGDSPLVVENARREPFFRGGAMVLHMGVGAYLGVPLRTHRGVVIGTLCALDTRERRVSPDDVRAMETIAGAMVAVLERVETPALLDEVLECTAPGREVYRQGWFDSLLGVELARAARGHASALLTIRGPSAHDVGGVALPAEMVGRLDADTIGVLLSGITPEAAAQHAARYQAALPGAEVRVATADAHFAELLRAGA
ncbi:MAG: GAF domain-containing protein [Polyangiaceae bacterium]